MILYLIKSGLCLAVLLAIYLVLLEREKMHRFNRVFLLYSLVIGLSIPFYTIDIGNMRLITEAPAKVVETISSSSSQFIENAIEPKQFVDKPVEAAPGVKTTPLDSKKRTENSFQENEIVDKAAHPKHVADIGTEKTPISTKLPVAEDSNKNSKAVVLQEEIPISTSEPDIVEAQTPDSISVTSFSLKEGILIAYGLVVLILLSRLIFGLYAFYRKRRSHPLATYGSAHLALLAEQTVPHTFLNTIYVNKDQFESGELSRQILDHELTHAEQKHSLDVLFVELIRIVFWFNPIFYFYKRAIQINHEFLADESVIKKTEDSISYQRLLLDSIFPSYKTNLASTFNYSLTKKRFKMMAKKSSLLVTVSKKVILIPIILSVGLIFCTKSNHSDLPLYNTGFYPNVSNANEVYKKPELTWKIEEIDGVRRGFSADSKGEPFTGVQEFRLVKNDKVFRTMSFKNGVTHTVTMYYDSTGVTDYKTSEDRPIIKDGQKIGNEFVEFVDGKEILQYRNTDAEKTKDGYGYSRSWYDSGQLSSEYRSRDNILFHGLFTGYNESGQVTFQVRFIKNEQVELLVENAEQDGPSNGKTIEIDGTKYVWPFFRPRYTSVDTLIFNKFTDYISKPENQRLYYNEEGKKFDGKWIINRSDRELPHAEYKFSNGKMIESVEYNRDPVKKEVIEWERKLYEYENGDLKSSKVYKQGELSLIIEHFPEYFYVKEFEEEQLRREYKILKNTPRHDPYTGSYIEYNEAGEIGVQKLYDDEGNEIATPIPTLPDYPNTTKADNNTAEEIKIEIQADNSLLVDGQIISLEELENLLVELPESPELVGIKVNNDAEFGVVTDVQNVLRRQKAFKINYSDQKSDSTVVLTLPPVSSLPDYPNDSDGNTLYPSIELSMTGKTSNGHHITIYKDKSGSPFTGVSELRFYKDDRLHNRTKYEDGIMVSNFRFDAEGEKTHQYDYKVTEDGFRVKRGAIFLNGEEVVIEEWKFPEDSIEGIGTHKLWYENGSLKFDATFKQGFKYVGLMTKYDQEGNIEAQKYYDQEGNEIPIPPNAQ